MKLAKANKSIIVANFFILLITIIIVCFCYVYFSPLFVRESRINPAAAATVEDKEPPLISKINVDELSATSTTISWETDEDADSLINYNIRPDYGIVRDPLPVKIHKLVIPELLSDQAYFYRIISSDVAGNQKISNDYVFTTKPVELPPETTPETPPAEGLPTPETPPAEQQLIQNTIKLIQQIPSEEGLSLIESTVQGAADEVAKAPVITGDFAKVEIGSDFAIIKWKTDKESNSMVSLATESEYRPNSDNSYSWNQGEPNEQVLTHEVRVQGLRPATTYHYQVRSKSSLDLEGVSEDNTFRTKSILPEIFNLTVAKVQEDSATITWNTNVPASAIVEYTDLNTNLTKLEGNTTLMTTHSIQLNGLKFDTYYSAIVKVENEQAEKTVSEPVTFTTTKDVVPPIISKINTESTLYPGADNKTQTIISWRTDEPSTCQFFFHQGLTVAGEVPDSLPAEEDFTTNHVQVVTAFQPATVYKFWIQCNDKTLNKVKSEDYTMLTPAKEQSILDLIIKNFEGTFGWLKKM
jgi:hypothetical protein